MVEGEYEICTAGQTLTAGRWNLTYFQEMADTFQ
jgi:hypothetical protein